MTEGLYDTMKIMPLGGGQEVGRSCILLEFKGRSILLDCGSHPGIEGTNSLPFFDALDDPSSIDMILITHFHIDHVAALPYFTEKTEFKGRIFMTHATKAVMKLLLSDNIKLQVRSKPLYNEQDLERCVDKIEVLDFYQTLEYKGIRVTASKAGHVLGACMYTIDIDGVRVLYTGDYSMEEDRHLPQADIPDGPPPDVLIVESTFGTITLSSREERESTFIRTVEHIVLTNRGACLIPVFALGRAQELLLLLDELWQRSPKLAATVPIYYASKLANKALKIYETFVNMMSGNVQQLLDIQGNPFTLRNVTRVAANADIDNVIGLSSGSVGGNPCVVVASPGFLQSGVSRYLFERWCDDPKNGVILAGYTVEGTLAHQLLNNPKEITCLDNRKKPLKCTVANISFSAHVDYVGNLKFIKAVNPGHIILVHGEKTQMLRLKSRLDDEIKQPTWGKSVDPDGLASPNQNNRKPKVLTPYNGQAIQLRFPQRINGEIVGSIATTLLATLDVRSKQEDGARETDRGQTLVAIPEGAVMITERFQTKIVSRDELKQFTTCRGLNVDQRVVVAVPEELTEYFMSNAWGSGSDRIDHLLIQYVHPFIEDVFDDLMVTSADDAAYYLFVQSIAQVSCERRTINGGISYSVVVEWHAEPFSDMIADSVTGIISGCMATATVIRSLTCPSTQLLSSLDFGSLKRKLKSGNKMFQNSTEVVDATKKVKSG